MSSPENAGKCREGFVYIPSGTFKMGSENGDGDERSARDVTVSAMCMKQSEVTIGEYDNSKKGTIDSDFPATDVNWEDAQKYCGMIGGRLPAGAEWEYAARGGMKDEYGTISNGLQSSETRKIEIKTTTKPCEYSSKGNCLDGSGARITARTNGFYYVEMPTNKVVHYGQIGQAKVCNYPENPFGLCDMLGNVYEWVADKVDVYGILRGGSWLVHDKYFLRAANRANSNPDDKSDSIGFRCVMAPK